MEFFWLGVVLLLSVIEMATADLITIWFIASGIVTLIISFFDIPFVAQVGIFVILGTVLLITTRKMLVEKLNKNKQKTNLDRVVGMEGIVTEKITKHNPGEVKVDGKKWTAISSDGKIIGEGKTVKIIKIEGVKLVVEEE
jgi:membrane protein implicated in regulation of membrane protease activity